MVRRLDAYQSLSGKLYSTWEEAATDDAVPYCADFFRIEALEPAMRRKLGEALARALIMEEDPEVMHALDQVTRIMMDRPSPRFLDGAEETNKGISRWWRGIVTHDPDAEVVE